MTAMAKMLQLSVLRISRLIAVADMAGHTRGQNSRPDPEARPRGYRCLGATAAPRERTNSKDRNVRQC